MNNDLTMIDFIVAQDPDLGLVGDKTLELTELLGLNLDMGDDGVCFPVPWARVFIDYFETVHVLRGLILGAPD